MKIIKNLAKKLLSGSRYQQQIALASVSTPHALKRIAERELTIKTVLDVGASNGSWSLAASAVWPKARYHLIEANPFWLKDLESLSARTASISYVHAAASDAPGKVYFDGSDPTSGIAMKVDSDQNDQAAAENLTGTTPGIREVAAVSLDSEVKRLGLEGPFLIKLDTHGYEVPILEGASQVLKETNLAVIETYNFQLQPESLKFYEMCQYMDALGFAPVDISEPLWRKKDQSFWQIDFFFVRKDRPEFKSSAYE